ncbi:SDR family NAD(P)-dependent oxidoreductase [Natronolimnohabitans innermongolicus]|uniref:Short-chain dehydrogenase/reductase SDR n=1 Tax=Natronolimnohabitans innermongolicus JCM 12255 TaxID=1227499 RepID=L9XA47_9EURY|nr:SDR family oxidoreductase [Natronolimnohabitans innermongolicus]ELY58629.1 short-chain dehydrogenase/reductase SDR [Natronolimnohabitans innermongolicus JCM 12255]
MRLEGKTAIITGAGSGLGREAATLFASEGATIVAADIDLEGAEETIDLVEKAGQDGAAIELDVRDAEAVQAAVDETVAEYGLDIAVNNAGVSHQRANVEEIDAEERDRVIDVNVKGVWNGCQAVIPHFKEQGSGAIVNTSSLAGVIGAPQLGAYSLSKGAVANFTRTVAAEVGPAGVRANAVCPGVTDTAMPRKGKTTAEWEQTKEEMARYYPLKRLGEPEDIANAMLFLASDEAAWITGQALVVDGGFSCA